jgi:hypothetical protein
VQPLVTFPSTSGRAFTRAWYTHTWIEYSATRDAAYCFPCRHFAAGESNYWTKGGFANWKKGPKEHAAQKKHLDAVAAWEGYQRSKEKGETVVSQLSSAHAELHRETHEWIKFVSRVLRHCASQEIALRAHREGSQAENKGNFLETMNLVLRHSEEWSQIRRKIPQNAHYLSHESQNDLLRCMASMVQASIVRKVREVRFWSIIADETRDVSKTEQLSICIRYWDTTEQKSCLREDCLTLAPLDAMHAAYIAGVITDKVESLRLSWEHLVGQAYDGASTMSGCIAGVSTLIKEKAPAAIYVHCWAHKLNLALVAASNREREVFAFFALLEALYVYISGTVPHALFCKMQQLIRPGVVRELKKLSETRWSCRSSSIAAVKQTFPALLLALGQLANDSDNERASSARGLICQLDFGFVVRLHMYGLVFESTNLVSKQLQEPSLVMTRALILARSQIDRIREFPSRFDSLWDDAASSLSELKADMQNAASLIHRTRTNRKTVEKEKLRAEFVSTCKTVADDMAARFGTPDHDVMAKGLEALLPGSDTLLEPHAVVPFAKLFRITSDEILLTAQLLSAKHMLKRENPELQGLLQLGDYLLPYRGAFSLVVECVTVAITIPVSSASAERCFSAVKRIMTRLRSSMSDERLSDLTILSIHSALANNLDEDEIVSRYLAMRTRRA